MRRAWDIRLRHIRADSRYREGAVCVLREFDVQDGSSQFGLDNSPPIASHQVNGVARLNELVQGPRRAESGGERAWRREARTQ
jgi:hypothetical protein